MLDREMHPLVHWYFYNKKFKLIRRINSKNKENINFVAHSATVINGYTIDNLGNFQSILIIIPAANLSHFRFYACHKYRLYTYTYKYT